MFAFCASTATQNVGIVQEISSAKHLPPNSQNSHLPEWSKACVHANKSVMTLTFPSLPFPSIAAIDQLGVLLVILSDQTLPM